MEMTKENIERVLIQKGYINYKIDDSYKSSITIVVNQNDSISNIVTLEISRTTDEPFTINVIGEANYSFVLYLLKDLGLVA